MAAILATIKGRVLIQIEGGEPVEVGTLEIPIAAGSPYVHADTAEEVQVSLSIGRNGATARMSNVPQGQGTSSAHPSPTDA